MKAKLFGFVVASAISTTVMSTNSVQAQAPQNAQPQVSVVNLKVVKDASGTQSVVTPKGDLAPLPGGGVNGGIAQIYIGSNGGFWYTDRTGQTIDLTPAVQALQARRAQSQQQVQVPQYAPDPNQQQQQQQQTTSSSGGSALGTAAAAGLGAMTGAALTNAYRAPYGTPMYYPRGGTPYYYHNGERRTVEDLNSNQKAVMYNKHQTKQQNQQQAKAGMQNRYDQRQTNIQNRQQAYGNSQNSPRSRGHNQQYSNIQKQQNWYQSQLKQNNNRTQQWKQQTHNPFVAQGNTGRRHSTGHHSGGRFADKRASFGGRAGHSRAGRGGPRGRRGR